MKKARASILLLFALLATRANAQQTTPPFDAGILRYAEFIGYVKKYHPLAKQANLALDRAQASLMEARGAFDPKLELDFETKEFKGTEYYDVFNSSFKIPTWYGIEVKAAFDKADGAYLNPQNTTPVDGLASVGLNIPIGQGLWINERMAALRQAKQQLRIGEAEMKLMAADVLYEASVAYFNWLRAYEETKIYEKYTSVASQRYKAIRRTIELGDKPAIDSVESGISVKMRNLGLEESKLKLTKARLSLSNYLWLDGTPLEISEAIQPEANAGELLLASLKVESDEELSVLQDNPKLQMLEGKLSILDIERRFRANQLLPKLNAGYYYISEPGAYDWRNDDYKFAVSFSYPLFLRKERSKLRLAKIKLQEERFGLEFERVRLANKLSAIQNEIANLETQIEITSSLTADYQKLLDGEERMFTLGESSLFLVNSRENSLITNSLAEINLRNRMLLAWAEFYRTTANFP